MPEEPSLPHYLELELELIVNFYFGNPPNDWNRTLSIFQEKKIRNNVLNRSNIGLQ